MALPVILLARGPFRRPIACAMLAPILMVVILSGLPHHHAEGPDRLTSYSGSESKATLGPPSAWIAAGSSLPCPACLHHRISWGEPSGTTTKGQPTLSAHPALVFASLLILTHPLRPAGPRAPPRG